jgi:hypothetical protein
MSSWLSAELKKHEDKFTAAKFKERLMKEPYLTVKVSLMKRV